VTTLLVEDEQRVASFVVKGLEAEGYAVEHVATGMGALARVRAGEPDLIVLHLTLPDFDGLELRRRLREGGLAAPVIILSARRDVDDHMEALEVGADDYLNKRFRFDELLDRLRARLRPPPPSAETVLRRSKNAFTSLLGSAQTAGLRLTYD
jgi:two-component system copper resistance phosphate regulon response regulator CusR